MKSLLKTIWIIGMVGIMGCIQNLKLEKYSSNDPDLDVILDYIPGWQITEQKGSYDSFTQVVFVEPIKKDKGLRASMVLTVKKEGKVEFSPNTAKGAYDDLIKKRMSFQDAKVISEASLKLWGLEAIEAQLSYKSLDMPESTKAKLVPFKERIVIFKRADKFYILRYENFANDFNSYNQAFSQIVKSLKFRDTK